MPNFLSVGWIEPFDIIASLKSRLGDFKGTGTRFLPLRGATRDEPDEYRDTRELTRWPEMRAILDRLSMEAAARQQGEIEIGRVYLEMLDSGAGTRPRSDRGSPWLRLIYGLRCNPLAYLWCPPEQRVLTPGEVLLTSAALFHGAVNMGEFSRINLVVDLKASNGHIAEVPAAEATEYLQ